MTVKQLNTAINNLEYSPYAPVPVFPDAQPQQILYIQENPDLFPGVVAPANRSLVHRDGSRRGQHSGLRRSNRPEPVPAVEVQGVPAERSDRPHGGRAAYESVLRGRPGVEKIQVNSAGQVLTTLASTPPVPGHNLC